jgi:SAM-dependent methyltransferase
VQVTPKHDQETNLLIYTKPEITALYAARTEVTGCEELLFDTYLRPGSEILDLGVGGGRTTPYLSRNASRYVGVDYSEEMIRVCRSKFSHLQFEVADACDLSNFADMSFDTVVFSFNGLDYLVPDEKRYRCLQECYRVLRKQGVFIFSTHNPRCLFLDLHWDLPRLRTLAKKVTGGVRPLFYPALAALTGARVGLGLVRSLVGAIPRAYQRLPTKAFWQGEGYVIDHSGGGLITHCAVPVRTVAELTRFQFRLLRKVPDDYPHRGWQYSTRWDYYAFSKD